MYEFSKKTTIRLFNQLKVNNTVNRSYLLRLYEEILKNNTFGKTRTTTTICKVIKESCVAILFSDKGEIERLPNSSGYKSPGTQPNEQLSKL